MQGTMPKSYRLSAHHRNVAVAHIIAFSLFGLVAMFSVGSEPDDIYPSSHLFVLVHGLGWSCLALLGVYLLVQYKRYRLIVDRNTIRQIDVFTDHRIALADVTALQWRSVPDGRSVRLTTPTRTLKIEFTGFEKGDCEQLIGFLRDFVGLAQQSGWEDFMDFSADEVTKQDHTWRNICLLIILIPVCYLILLTLDIMGFEHTSTASSVITLLICLYLFSPNHAGRKSAKKRANPTG